MIKRLLFVTLSLICSMYGAKAQQSSLQMLIDSAVRNNNTIKIAALSLETRSALYEGSKKNILPKVELLAGYNYLGKPIQINLQQTKDGIVNGTASQAAESADILYQNITGNALSNSVKDVIYQTSKDIISTVYPNYNPEINKQSYLMAGVALLQPIYLGGKLKAEQNLNKQQVNSAKINLENAQELITFNTTLQYLQVLFYNSMIKNQEKLINQLKANVQYASSMLKAEIIPPYQKNWADIALQQGEASLQNFILERDNALITLKHIVGVENNYPLDIKEEIPEKYYQFQEFTAHSTAQNSDLRLLDAKKNEASTALSVVKSAYKPNVFGLANYQFFRKDLPLITPPWMIGAGLQWTLFNGFETQNKVKAAKSLVNEIELLRKEKEQDIQSALKIAQNKIQSFYNQSVALNQARNQTYTTTEMVRKRMENELSSVKDVNDALQLQLNAEKLFYTSLLAYYSAVASYFYLNGEPNSITSIIK